jgi:hypothetical protein
MRIRHSEETTQRNLEVKQEELDEEVLQGRTKKTAMMYDMDDQEIHPDAPMHSDLNKNKTVKGLARGGAVDMLRTRFLEKYGPEQHETDEPPVMEDLGIASGGDGAPVNTFILQERLKPEQYEDIRDFAGGFHNLLNYLQKCGSRFPWGHSSEGISPRFGDTHLKAFLHHFRNILTRRKTGFFAPVIQIRLFTNFLR